MCNYKLTVTIIKNTEIVDGEAGRPAVPPKNSEPDSASRSKPNTIPSARKVWNAGCDTARKPSNRRRCHSSQKAKKDSFWKAGAIRNQTVTDLTITQ